MEREEEPAFYHDEKEEELTFYHKEVEEDPLVSSTQNSLQELVPATTSPKLEPEPSAAPEFLFRMRPSSLIMTKPTPGEQTNPALECPRSRTKTGYRMPWAPGGDQANICEPHCLTLGPLTKLYLWILLQDAVQSQFLYDTEADVSCISEQIFCELPTAKLLPRAKNPSPICQVANGLALQEVGYVTLQFHPGNQDESHDFKII
jgi:hypothetical protein